VNFFVPINYIHNIIINEVVYNVSFLYFRSVDFFKLTLLPSNFPQYKVIFVLTALTKGEIHYEKPIIPLMNVIITNRLAVFTK
jgi:hypothetical protein